MASNQYDTGSTSASEHTPVKVTTGKDDGTHLLESRVNSTSSGDKLPFPFPEEKASPRADVVEFVQKVALRTKEGLQYRRAHYDWLDWLSVFLPCIKWLRTYDIKKFLVADFIAGLSVGFMVIPQGMSYANLAGLPSVYGLYGAFVPVLIYAVFGSSRQLAVGPVAVTSLLIGQNLPKIIEGADQITTPNTPTPEQEPIQAAYNRAAIQLAFLVAVLYTAVGVLRLGYITNFLSHSVIGGFTSGAAITIGLSQLKYVLGISVARKDSLQEQVELYLDNIRNFRWEEFIMGVCLMLVLVLFREVGKKFKRFSWMRPLGPIAACVISLLTSYIGKVDKHGIRVIASIPKGLPKPTVQWWFPMENFDQLMSLAIIIMLVDLLESTSIARALARKNNYELVPNQEITGLGLANFAGACFSAYTTTGSFSRSAVNNASGAKTGLAGFFTAWTVAFVLLFLTPVFEHLTYNTLGAIVIVAVTGLFEYEQAVYLFRVNKLDWLVWMASFCGTLFINIEIGLAISIGLAVLIVVYESAFPHTAVLGRVSHTSSVYRNIKQYPDAQVLPGILIVRIDAAIYFANVQWIKDQLHKYKSTALKYSANAGVPLEYVVLDFSPVPHVDAQGLHALEHLLEEHAQEGIQTAFANINAKVIKELEAGGIPSAIGRDWIFVSVADAVESIAKSMQERGQAPKTVSAAEVLDGVSVSRRLQRSKTEGLQGL